MSALDDLLSLTDAEKTSRGLVHTPLEIAQQPATWRTTFQVFLEHHSEIAAFLASARVLVPDSGIRPSVFLIGAGTSDYIGHALAPLLRRMWQCDISAVPSTDLLTHADELAPPNHPQLWISFSRSGDSPEGVAVLQDAFENRPQIQHLIVTCNANGRMLKIAAGRQNILGICLDDSVNDRGLAMTSSFSNMVLFGQFLAHVASIAAYEPILAHLISAAESLMPSAADCASELSALPFTKACFVGSGALRAVARESALKLLELTAGKTLTMSESALGLRHGPMAALDHETLFVSFLSSNPRIQHFELDLLKEIRSKRLVQTIVAVATQPMQQATATADYQLISRTPAPVPDDYRPVVDVIFGQLLGLFFSLRNGLRPDSPSPNGAISRVVQNVNIHA
jgi:tagatose-6-phosphate ketose/aldose isomerase